MTRTKFYITLTAALCVSLSASGKEAVDTLSVPSTQFSMEKLIHVTDSLTKNYRFSEAAGLFETAKAGADSLSAILIDEAMIQAQNGDNMTGFCSNPVAVARERFSLNDFFLFYPLKDHSWETFRISWIPSAETPSLVRFTSPTVPKKCIGPQKIRTASEISTKANTGTPFGQCRNSLTSR